ncbi:iron ABC transporter permease [Candidatus Bipolaricaulota bacterium]|nr:iron ABC transporter permease [Candidatus Bipolaricaulota bacterium]
MSTSDAERVKASYESHFGRKLVFIFIAAIMLLLLAVFSLGIGAVNFSVTETAGALLGRSTRMARTIIWNIRVPRVLTAILVGSGLAVAGAALQSLLRNPLASPYTLGISHAAAFGAAFSVVVLGAGSSGGAGGNIVFNNPYITVLSAFGWSMITVFIIVTLGRLKNSSPVTLILTGIALGSLFTAGYTVMQSFADQSELSSIVFWTFGDVGRTNWLQLAIIAVVVIPVALYFVYRSWQFRAMSSGDETAKSLGVKPKRLRLIGTLLAGLITALMVSFVGIIGFVGLVVPHIVRRFIGGEERSLIPASCLVGSILLLGSDTAARTVVAPIVLPVGILTSFLGVPLFIYLVIRGKEYW